MSYNHIVDIQWQNRLKVRTDKAKLKVKMQSVSDDNDVRKRLLGKPCFVSSESGTVCQPSARRNQLRM